MPFPSLNSLRMFDASARSLNFRKAADELNITQGAVSQQVRKLEDDLSLKLFHRQARGLALTETGKRYAASVRQALQIIEDATSEIAGKNTVITLSVPPSVASKWLVPRLTSFSQNHPDIELVTVASEELANFASDGVDLAIRQGKPPFSSHVVATQLSPLNLCAVCSPAYLKAIGPFRELSDLLGYPLIHDSHNHWNTLFQEAGLKPPGTVMRFNQTALAMDAAANGDGIALVPSLLAEHDIAAGRLKCIFRTDDNGSYGYYLVHPSGPEQLSPALIEMKHWLLKEATAG